MIVLNSIKNYRSVTTDLHMAEIKLSEKKI